MRVNVTVPDELWAAAKSIDPGLNVSGVLQEGLRALLSCEHRQVVCERCAVVVDVAGAIDEGRAALGWAVWLRVAELVEVGGTAEGAARVVRDELLRQRVPARGWALPRPSRAARAAARAPAELEPVRVSRDVQAARDRHPTARTLADLPGTGNRGEIGNSTSLGGVA